MQMQGTFEALSIRKRKLVERKTELRHDYERAVAEIDKELADINTAIDVFNKAIEPYKCPHCKGTGTYRRCDAAGQMEDWTCEACRGTGIKLDI